MLRTASRLYGALNAPAQYLEQDRSLIFNLYIYVYVQYLTHVMSWLILTLSTGFSKAESVLKQHTAAHNYIHR